MSIMKKLLPLCLLCLLMISAAAAEEYVLVDTQRVSLGNVVESGKVNDTISWALNDAGTLTVYGTGSISGSWVDPFYSSATKLVVASGVTNFDDELCWDDTLQTVELASSVTSLGEWAFYSCENLQSVSGPGVKSIGNMAFPSCTALKSVSFPKVETIGDEVFYCCEALTSVSFPYLTSAGGAAFGYCPALKSAYLPKLQTIGAYAFHTCTSLTDLTLSSLTAMGEYAFDGCTALKSIYLPKLVNIEEACLFLNCSSLTSVSLPALERIDNTSVFSGCESLTSLSFPNLTSVGDYAFSNFPALESVNFPKLETIGEEAFSACTALTDIALPSLTAMGESAFSECTALESISLPKLKTTALYAFDGCTALTDVSLPLTEIVESHTFEDCAALKEISLPNAVILKESAFSCCEALETVEVGDRLEEIYDLGLLVFSLKSFTLPGSVKIVGSWALARFTDVTYTGTAEQFRNMRVEEYNAPLFPYYIKYGKDMTYLPDGLESIRKEAFMGTELINICCPQGLTRIDSKAFANIVPANYAGLARCVYIPASVQFIAQDAFDGTEITIVCDTVDSYAWQWAEGQGLARLALN